jgi:hypothetical protein
MYRWFGRNLCVPAAHRRVGLAVQGIEDLVKRRVRIITGDSDALCLHNLCGLVVSVLQTFPK